jgi:FKBP-type peptidyl-prolyl cis-trans isomerase
VPAPLHALLRASLALSPLAFACAPERAPTPASEGERTSYAIGLHVGMRLRDMQAGLDLERISEGFRDGSGALGAGKAAELQPDEIRLELAGLAAATRTHEAAARGETAARNARSAEAFLARNAARPDVVQLPSGVQYRVLEPGSEAPPSLADRVTVEYEARLLDGAVFDTSADRSAPTIVRLRRTPRAWREVLTRVGGGGSVEMWAPALASGEPPIGLAPPGELTVFRVRVVAVDRPTNPELARAPPRRLHEQERNAE